MDVARQAAEQSARRSYGRLVAWLSAQFKDIALAEDAVGEAFTKALGRWPETGVPDNPEGWLATVARREILHQKSRAHKLDEAMPYLKMVSDERSDSPIQDWPDQRLKLMFACTHPAVDATMHTPLILQTVLGFNAAQIGSAFLVSPTSMGQRLVRLKKKIAGSGIAFSVPDAEDLNERLEAVLDAIYVAFGLSWSDPESDTARDMSDEAIWLAGLVDRLLPDRAEVLGLQALMLFAHSRRRARRSPDGVFVPLSEQDCELWDAPMIIEAEARLARAAAIDVIGRYQLEAAIQGAHAGRARFGLTDWQTIVGLYERLWEIHPTLSVFLGRAAAFAGVQGPQTGIALLDEIPPDHVQSHQPYWATRADLLAKLNQPEAARDAYNRALGLTEDPSVRDFLQSRLKGLL